jgi:transposase InsO family protein
MPFHDRSEGTYGSPRAHADLIEAGHRHGRKRVAGLMRESGTYGRTRRRWVTTTVADPDAPGRPDLINRDFRTNATGLDLRWCGDITYIQAWEGWAYLATVIDIASRRVVGWVGAAASRRFDARRAAVASGQDENSPGERPSGSTTPCS